MSYPVSGAGSRQASSVFRLMPTIPHSYDGTECGSHSNLWLSLPQQCCKRFKSQIMWLHRFRKSCGCRCPLTFSRPILIPTCAMWLPLPSPILTVHVAVTALVPIITLVPTMLEEIQIAFQIHVDSSSCRLIQSMWLSLPLCQRHSNRFRNACS